MSSIYTQACRNGQIWIVQDVKRAGGAVLLVRADGKMASPEDTSTFSTEWTESFPGDTFEDLRDEVFGDLDEAPGALERLREAGVAPGLYLKHVPGKRRPWWLAQPVRLSADGKLVLFVGPDGICRQPLPVDQFLAEWTLYTELSGVTMASLRDRVLGEEQPVPPEVMSGHAAVRAGVMGGSR